MKVAILGASGFIGSRVIEIFHLEGAAEVIPIVRGTNSLARLARFSMEWRVADALDRPRLAEAFRGCEVLIHAVVGSSETIIDASRAGYLAAQDAGVRRIVYLSTASVHGQNPPPGTNEDSPLHSRHPIPYNNAKVRAELEFRQLRQKGSVELVVLRPGIVFGPRDQWISGIARSLLERTAYLVRGKGICNTIYVDNLVHAIRLAMTAPADGKVFLVGDRETVTWRELYRRVADALQIDFSIPEVDPSVALPEHIPLPERLKEFDLIRAAVPRIPQTWKRKARLALETLSAMSKAARTAGMHSNPWSMPGHSSPSVSLETALLHQCAHKFDYGKAARGLGYEPPLSFDEGMRRTLSWLRFVDVPIAPEKP